MRLDRVGRRSLLALGGVCLCRSAGAEWLRDEVVVFADPAAAPVIAASAAGFPNRVRCFSAPPGQLVQLLAHRTQDDLLIAPEPYQAEAERLGVVKPGGARLWRNRLVFAIAATPARAAAPADFSLPALIAMIGDGKLAVPDATQACSVDGPALLATLHVEIGAQLQGVATIADALGMLHDGTAQVALAHVSEVMADPGLRVAQRVPDDAYAPIVYQARLYRDGWSRVQDKYMAYLAGKTGGTARAFGLEVL